MANCERCKKGGIGLTRSGIKFKDKKYICMKCLKELGHDHPLKNVAYLSSHTSEEILHPEITWERDRLASLGRDANRLGITSDQVAALNAAHATEFEMNLFSHLCALLRDEGCSCSSLFISPGDDGSLYVLQDDTVLMQYKGEPDIKWIILPDEPDNKIRFARVSKLNSLADRIVAIYRSNK